MSPIRIRDYMVRHENTSTPERYFAKIDVSSIHHVVTDESAANLPEAEQSAAINKNLDRSESAVRPVFVGARRPKPFPKEALTISPIGRKDSLKTVISMGVQDEEANDNAAMISMASAMEISSILEESNKMCSNVSDNSFELSKPKAVQSPNIVSEHNKTEDIHDKTGERSVMDTFDLQKSSIFKADDSSIWLNETENIPIVVHAEVEIHRTNDTPIIDTISVSSTSTTTTLSTSSASMTTANQAKHSVKPRVGFDASNSIHELSVVSQQNESSQKLVMKGGKWRRTVFESRKNKVTQCKSN